MLEDVSLLIWCFLTGTYCFTS